MIWVHVKILPILELIVPSSIGGRHMECACYWKNMFRFLLSCVIACSPFLSTIGRTDEFPLRTLIPWSQNWEIRSDGTTEWKPIDVGDSWEQKLGMKFDGIATYRKQLPKIVNAFSSDQTRSSIYLEFQAVATHAVVMVEGKKIGEHLGGWTPWRVDITEHYREGAIVEVRVDERVGHNTQGFLPVFLPHFGGVWQTVNLIVIPRNHIDEMRFFAAGWKDEDSIECRIPVSLSGLKITEWEVGVRITEPDQTVSGWTWMAIDRDGIAQGKVTPKTVRRWTPDDPHRYPMEVVLRQRESQQTTDALKTLASIRRVEAHERRILLNQQPIIVRGVLNWGYAPPRIAPSISEEHMRNEIVQAKAMGFNLMKFCLWVPPKRYLELCDELGMLAWVEYPTWHPKLTEEYLSDLRQEYEEFFHHDRNHPCVILRSLTCETGPSAELSVIQSLYDRGHELIPGCLIEDDSSWISWNRVHDFYDDHPYGNNHTWENTLDELDRYIRERSSKPLVLGEAIAADTWTEVADMDRAGFSSDSPHRLRSAGKMEEYKKQLEKWCGSQAMERMANDAHRNALAMRRFQIGMFRRRLPDAGYVVSVLRDFPFASMGLLNFQGEPKWTAKEWAWHRDEVDENAPRLKRSRWAANSSKEYQPSWSEENQSWLIPDRKAWSTLAVQRHVSIDASDERLTAFASHGSFQPKNKTLQVIASRFDEELLNFLIEGGKVLLLPDGGAGSPPLADHWFLRGGVVFGEHSKLDRPLQDLIADLQLFDLAGPVIRQPSYLDEVTPLVLLWDNHDLDHFRTHALAYMSQVGQGKLLVSTLNHQPERGPAALYVLGRFAEALDASESLRRMSQPTIDQLRSDLTVRVQEMEKVGWKFQPDKANQGLVQGWHRSGFDRSTWLDIEIGRHWDAQGFGAVDGWAWYAKKIRLPASTRYITFTGVDDYFELYVDGQRCGSGGDREKKLTAFEQTISIELPTAVVSEGSSDLEVELVVRVEDWQGAGGIFRPVFLGNEPMSSSPPILVRP